MNVLTARVDNPELAEPVHNQLCDICQTRKSISGHLFLLFVRTTYGQPKTMLQLLSKTYSTFTSISLKIAEFLVSIQS